MDVKDETIMDSDVKVNLSYPRGVRLARAYVPVQIFTRKFDLFEGFERGTIFLELCRPYRETEK